MSKTVIEMVREAADPDKVDPWRGGDDGFWVLVPEELERFAELVRADERNSWSAEMEAMERQVNILTDALAQEREACAKMAEDYLEESEGVHFGVGAAIRARSNT